MKFRTSFDLSGADKEARAIKDLIQRHWHLESVGLGNCRTAQELKREIDRRTALKIQQPAQAPLANCGIPSKSGHVNPANRAGKKTRAIKDLVDRLWHLDSVGLGNCRAAQAIERELHEQLLIQSAALANADFNSLESRDRYGKWTTGSNAAPSATNSPSQATAHGTAVDQTDGDDTDDIPLTYGGAHAKLRQSQSDASAQLYNKSGGEMKAVAAGGRAAAEMNPIVAFIHGIYQFFTKKDAIDSNKQLTTAEQWKSLGSAAMAAAPTVLKGVTIAKDVAEAGEVAQGLKKAEGAVVGTEKAAQEVKKVEDAGAGAAKATEDSANLKPYGGPGGGHHVPAKSVFTGNSAYDINKALAVPNAELTRLGLDHGLISVSQQRLYRAFVQTRHALTWNDVQKIETEALISGGMKSVTAAEATVKQAINALKANGITAPTRIPWGK